MDGKRRNRALRIAAAWAGLAMIIACGGNQGDSASGDDETATETSSAALSALERHLVAGQSYGEGPDGVAIAAALHSRFPDDAVAVHVTPGPQRVIVVLLSFQDLSQISNGDRENYLENFLSTLDLRFLGSSARIGIGLRGRLLYGAVGTRDPGQATLQMSSGAIVSRSSLDALMAVADGALPTEPAITLGLAVMGTFDASDHFGNRRWVFTTPAPAVVHLQGERSDGVTDSNMTGVWATICPGNTFNSDCDTMRDDETYDAALAPGTYTVFGGIAPGCDVETDNDCWQVPTPFDIMLSQGG